MREGGRNETERRGGDRERCSGSEAGWYLRLTDCVYHSTLGVRVTKKKQKSGRGGGGG